MFEHLGELLGQRLRPESAQGGEAAGVLRPRGRDLRVTVLLKAVPLWVWLLILLVAVLAGALVCQTLALADARRQKEIN